MYLKTIFYLFLLSSSVAGSEYEFTTGFGHQYGGVLGTQFSSKDKDSKYYASLGLVGIAFGFQKQFKDQQNHSYGFSIGSTAANADKGFLFANYNYHFEGFSGKGWVVGAGIGVVRHEDSATFFIQTLPTKKVKNEVSITLDFGYKF